MAVRDNAADVMLKSALLYAEKFGFSVFPCRARGKEPLTEHGFQEASRDPETICAWWRRWPQANVGIATGAASGIVVLDVDLKADGPHTLAILEDEHGRLPETPTVLTGGGGQHLYFRDSGGLRNSVGALGSGLDVRADGGYVIAPPSIHPNGGKYDWEVSLRVGGLELAAIPPWLLERMKPSSSASAAVRFEMPAQVAEGTRNETLFRFGRSFRARGFGEAQILGFLKVANKDRCKPPLREREIERIAHQAATERDRPEFVPPAATTSRRDEAEVTPPPARSWPEPPAPDAFYGLAGKFVDLVKPQTEADQAALLLQFLVLFGNVVGHGPSRRGGGQAHHLAEYVVIVGATKSGRKGTSYSEVERFFHLVDPVWLDARKSGGLVSGEGLIWAVRDQIVKKVPTIRPNDTPAADYRRQRKKNHLRAENTLLDTAIDEPTEKIIDEGIGDKRLLVVETEYSATLKASGRDGSTLSDVMRKAWDGSVLGTLSKNNPARATGAHISIIGHITPDELLRNLDSTEAANGFGNRHLWCASRRQRELPWGGSVQHEQMNDLAARVKGAVERAKCIGEFAFDESAMQLWEKVYHDLSADRPGLLGAMVARGEPHVLRLSMIYAALDSTSTIGEAHLKAALAVWAYCVQSAEYFFGERLGDPIADTVIEALRSYPAGLTTTEIHGLFSRNVKANQLEAARGRLLQYGRIRIERKESGGRPLERWLLT